MRAHSPQLLCFESISKPPTCTADNADHLNNTVLRNIARKAHGPTKHQAKHFKPANARNRSWIFSFPFFNIFSLRLTFTSNLPLHIAKCWLFHTRAEVEQLSALYNPDSSRSTSSFQESI